MEANRRFLSRSVEWDITSSLLYETQGQDDTMDRRDGGFFFVPFVTEREIFFAGQLTRRNDRTKNYERHCKTTRTKSGAS